MAFSYFRLVIVLGSTCVCIRAQDSAAGIMRKAIEAMGGMETAAKWTGSVRFTMKGTVTIGDQAYAAVSENWFQPPNQIKTVLTTTQLNGSQELAIDVFDGKRAWRREHDQTAELDAARRTQVMHGLYSQRVEMLLPLIADPAFSVTTIPGAKVDGREALGVRVSSKGQEDIDLFFDKENGLLVKSARMAMDPDRDDVRLEDYFRNYRESGGGRRWTSVAMFEEGKKVLEMEMVSLQFVDHIPDGEFVKP
jgi:outer membrane lipoprotein-sorting protein